MKSKIKKIQILPSGALYSVAVILLIHHIILLIHHSCYILNSHGLMIKISRDIEDNPGSNQKQD